MRPIRYVLLDEVDRVPARRHGAIRFRSPSNDGRFPHNKKIVMASTRRFKGISGSSWRALKAPA